ncbi:D-alanyl-D-alanine carboxypeptidase family protein [Pelagibacterium montanilacus]|uniref:D-alanyl-D-alanine carboxypeptidase family protein n=1 Tax=Pelagibacterium montanilacus TaxID=2185280 RepID=UPI0013DF66B8|nr:D-alanyl-D-alanine carboxypeptidase family protein [Pelagibacterium montanilacus]
MPTLSRVLAALILALSSVFAAIAPAQALPQLLVDMSTGEVLHENEAGVPWHPASLTKLMTALLAFEAIETGQASLSTPVITTANALAAPPSKMGFPLDTAITLEDALYLLIIKSANDIAVAIAETIGGSEAVFVQMMNARAGHLGMTGTNFVNPHGLHDPAQVTTARDIAVLALVIRSRFPQYDAMFSTRTVVHGQSRSHTNNELLTAFSGTDGMKTGYVCASGLNIVATAHRNGRRLLAVTFGGSSSRERGEMTAQMLFSGFAGGYRGTGRSITQVANRTDLAPVNMRPNVCGAGAASYTEARKAEFPLGLDGQLSYLIDDIERPVHTMSIMGRLRDVPLPRPRPADASTIASRFAMPEPGPAGDSGPSEFAPSGGEPFIPLPRPRPAL